MHSWPRLTLASANVRFLDVSKSGSVTFGNAPGDSFFVVFQMFATADSRDDIVGAAAIVDALKHAGPALHGRRHRLVQGGTRVHRSRTCVGSRHRPGARDARSAWPRARDREPEAATHTTTNHGHRFDALIAASFPGGER
jgi:hypothetical protein